MDDIVLLSQPLDTAGEVLGPAVQISSQPVSGFSSSDQVKVRLHPDRQRIFYGSSGELFIVPLDASAAARSLGTNVNSYDFSPDGTYVVVSGYNSSIIRDGDFSTSHSLGEVAPEGELNWAQDGSAFAFTFYNAIEVTTHAVTVVSATRTVTDLTGLAVGHCIAISAAGTRVAYIRDGSAVVADTDGTNETVLGAAEVLRGSPDGSRFMYATAGTLSTALFDGTGVVNVDTGGGYYWLPYVGAFAPNAGAVQYYRDGSRFIADPVTADSGTDLGSGFALRWSPDGRFGLYSEGDMLMAASGAGVTAVAHQGITPSDEEIGIFPGSEVVVAARFVSPNMVLLSGKDASNRTTTAVVTVQEPTPPPAPLAAMDIPSAIDELRPIATGNETWVLDLKDCWRSDDGDIHCYISFRQDLPGTSDPPNQPDQVFWVVAHPDGSTEGTAWPRWQTAGNESLTQDTYFFFSGAFQLGN